MQQDRLGVLGYPAACWQPKQPNQVFLGLVYNSLTVATNWLLCLKNAGILPLGRFICTLSLIISLSFRGTVLQGCLFQVKYFTLFESENERQKIEPVPIPLPRVSRNFPDVKTRNEIFFHNWTLEIIPFIRFGKQMNRT